MTFPSKLLISPQVWQYLCIYLSKLNVVRPKFSRPSRCIQWRSLQVRGNNNTASVLWNVKLDWFCTLAEKCKHGSTADWLCVLPLHAPARDLLRRERRLVTVTSRCSSSCVLRCHCWWRHRWRGCALNKHASVHAELLALLLRWYRSNCSFETKKTELPRSLC